MPAEPRRLLVLMAKAPEPERTKTRLSPPLRPDEAAELYRCFLVDKLSQMRKVNMATPAIAYTPGSARAYFAGLAPRFTLIEQVGADLPARLRNMFTAAFEGGHTQVMAIDGDTPTLPPDYLRRGLTALDDPAVDVTLGPTEDGGYYAIGMKQPHPTLFEVRMSTPRVTADTLARADAAGLRVARLLVWYDIDRPEDLERLRAELSGAGRQAAPATARFLARLGRERPT